MPLDEEGAKWSCEPCVRGHRSSKCQHFDRLMMKVPKAGRPLAKCPHPKGTCSCQKLYAFMVRIPKGSTCLCRPLYKVPMVPTENGQSPAPMSMAPASSPAPGKVQKSGRRQSNLQAAPENIAKALDSVPEFSNQQVNNGTPTPGTAYLLQFPDFGTPSGIPTPSHGSTAILPKHMLETGGSVEAQKGSCCSKKPKPIQPAQEKGSCCSRGAPEIANVSDGVISSNVAPFTAFSGNQFPSWRVFNSSGDPFPPPQNPAFSQGYLQNPVYMNGFHIPGSSSAPPMNFAPSNLHENSSGFNPSPQQFVATDSHCYSAPPTFGGDSAHECSCGEDCQCLGCASHPFNNTTRQHIQEMGYMMTVREEDENSEGSDGSRNTPVIGTMSPTMLSYPAVAERGVPLNSGRREESTHNLRGQAQTPAFDYGFPAPSSTDYSSGRQLMQPSEYYEVEYPVPLPGACSDMTGTCQCGSDCSCVGCLTHSGHNGMPLEPPHEDAHFDIEKFTSPPIEPSVHNQAQAPTLDDFSFSSLSPPAVEPQLV